MRHANLAKLEVTEVAIFGLPVQIMKMSLIKASAFRYSQHDLKLLRHGCVELGSLSQG